MESTEAEKELMDMIIAKIKAKLETGICQELTSTWSDLWDEDERSKRREILSDECGKEIQDLLEEVAAREKKTKDDYIERIENLLTEMNDLQTNLEIAIPYEDVESLPLHDMAFHLNKKAEKYRLIKDERVGKMNALLKQESELCDVLGMIPSKMKFSPIPKKDELQKLEKHVAALVQEKTERELTVRERCQKISNLFFELDLTPSLKFEKDVVACQDPRDVGMSNENMKKLEALLERLESQVEDAKQTARELTDKLNTIWSYLDEPECQRKLFLDAHSGHSLPVIGALREELTRCETKKKENISKIVSKIRGVLTQEWDKCLVSEEERKKFRPFHINCFTEDLCELHELEIERLRNYYRNNEAIFNLIAKHEKLFQKLIQLENISKNADRYYNRGGKLLKEERDRKAITKELPIVEDELRGLLHKFEEDHGKPFASFGVPVLTILDEQWNAHFDQKTIDKLARKMGSDKKKVTPLGKRAMLTPGSSVATKMKKLNGERVVSSTTKTLTPCGSPGKFKLNTPMTFPQRKVRDDDALNAMFELEPTYEDFQNHLKEKVEGCGKEAIRSTAVTTTVKDRATTPERPPLREVTTTTTTTPNVLRSSVIKTTPAKLAATPMYSPATKKTPKTVPRSSRRENLATRRQNAKKCRPLII